MDFTKSTLHAHGKKKVNDIFVPSRDVNYQTLGGNKLIIPAQGEFGKPLTSRLVHGGTGMSLTFGYSAVCTFAKK